MSKLIDTTLDNVFKTTPIGSVDSAIGNAFYGINHRQLHSSIPVNKDTYGLTFFTRPQLNFSTPNLRGDRRYISLLTKNAESIQRIIRCYLDPRLNYDSSPSLPCQYVDHQSAFIPILTNHLLTISGWPDVTVDSYLSKPGAYREVFSHVDAVSDIYSAYDITATFRNMIGDPITKMFLYWVHYQSLVYQGILVPYPDFLIRNEIDYNTRIYRLVLDSNKRFVQKIGCCGAAYPSSVPIGASFNLTETDKFLNMSNQEIVITFKAIGAQYQDDILIFEFNKIVGIFNPSMATKESLSIMKKVPISLLNLFNNRGYPRIDPNTYELEWYVSQEDYAAVSQQYEDHARALSIPIN